MAILNMEKLNVFRREQLSARQQVARSAQEYYQLAEPTNKDEFCAFIQQLLSHDEITTAYAYALDVVINFDNWEPTNHNVVDLAGGYVPTGSMPQRLAEALWQASQLPPAERLALTKKNQKTR